jgi:hypothetical protein
MAKGLFLSLLLARSAFMSDGGVGWHPSVIFHQERKKQKNSSESGSRAGALDSL